MKNKSLLAALLAIVPIASWAGADGDCGVGSRVFDGQKGVAPQVLAMTTNSTFYQTFAVTSGTSGCNPNATVKSNWKVSLFIDENVNKLARDMSVGGGETLDTLAVLLGVSNEHKPVFFKTTQENFGQIFTSDSITSTEVAVSLKKVLAANSELAQYAVSI